MDLMIYLEMMTTMKNLLQQQKKQLKKQKLRKK
jgi:hypothetical protein